MIGKVFYHGVSPAEIKQMKWRELVYWDGWIEIIDNAKKDAIKDIEDR